MCQEPTELLWIGCLTGLTLTKKIRIRYIDTKHQLADMLTKGNFTRDEWNRSSSFFQYHPCQLHLLYQEFQLDKMLYKCEDDSKSKDERVVSKSRPAVMIMSSFLATSSSAASSPIASKSPGMPTASGKPDSRMSVEPSSLDAASTS